MTEKPFYQTEKSLWKAKGYYSPKTGNPVVFTNAEKIVYMYMLDRVVFFTENLKTLHFESQETIAEAVGLEKKAIGKILRAFTEERVVVGQKRKPDKGGQIQWFYSSVEKDLGYWVGVKEKPERINKVSRVQRLPEVVEEDFDSPHWA